MNRRQLSLLVVLGLISTIPALAADPSEQGAGWRTSSDQAAAGSTLSGKLYRNSADPGGSAPYVILDRWGVTRGYVAAAEGVELESCLGQQVSLQGTVKTLPGGDMPYMTCRRVLNGDAETGHAPVQHASPPVRHEALAVAVSDDRREEIAPQPALPTPSDMAADEAQESSSQAPAPRAVGRHRHASGVQSTNFEETLPEPVPAGEFHRSPAGSPMLGPTPMAEGPMTSEGPMVSEGPVVGRGPAGCDGCGEGQCDAGCGAGPCNACCDDGCGNICWGPKRPLYCWGPSGIWVKADYLQWWESGTHVPALVTTGPNADNPGYIGTPGTQVLFGDQTINNNSESGGRIQAGMWLNSCATVGIEGEFFALADENTNYYMWSDGNPIISRPFYDVGQTTPVENVELVAFPRGSAKSLDGAINIAMSRFHGAGAHFLFTTCRQETCSSDECDCGPTYHDRFRADFVAGYRYLDLEDQIGITETLTSTSPPPVTAENPDAMSAFLVHDQFNTQNTFNGGDLGMKFAFERNRWSLDLFPRIAIGSTHEVADISGSTRITSPVFNSDGVLTSSTQTTYSGGLLAQSTNIGHHEQDSFAVVPELDLNLGFQFTCHTRVVVGYSGMYWSKVARAGEQIDRTVNSTLIPPGSPLIGDPTRPQFSFQETGFWAQGVNVGLDCRW